MTPPSENDDDWAELARELARDKPQPPAVQPEPQHGFEDVPVAGDGMLRDGDEPADGAPESETEEVADGQPGTGRKRRRRRRRRRKAGQPADGSTATDSDEQDDSAEGPGEANVDEEESGFEDEIDPDPDTDVMVGSEVEADEDAGGELLRELIANWSVPSWDEVVGSLYRPER